MLFPPTLSNSVPPSSGIGGDKREGGREQPWRPPRVGLEEKGEEEEEEEEESSGLPFWRREEGGGLAKTCHLHISLSLSLFPFSPFRGLNVSRKRAERERGKGEREKHRRCARERERGMVMAERAVFEHTHAQKELGRKTSSSAFWLKIRDARKDVQCALHTHIPYPLILGFLRQLSS